MVFRSISYYSDEENMSADPGDEDATSTEDQEDEEVEVGEEMGSGDFSREPEVRKVIRNSEPEQKQSDDENCGRFTPNECDHSSFEAEISKLRKDLETAIRVKETTVMRYAKSEKEVIRKTQEMEAMEKQLKAAVKENEYLSKKNKMLSSERERLVSLVDTKICEIQSIRKDVEKLQEDNSAKDFQLKWTQSKLQAEQQAHKDTMSKLEKCESDLKEALERVQRMKDECNVMISDSVATLENSDAVSTETASESPPSITPAPKKTIPPPAPPEVFLKDIEGLKEKHKALIDENNSLSSKVQSLEVARLDLEQKVNRLQEQNASYLNQLGRLHTQLSTAETWKLQLEQLQDRVGSIQNECDQLRTSNSELLADMAVCREKEAELLTYTQQVTDKNVQLQSQFSAVEAQSILLAEENRRLQGLISQLDKEYREAVKAHVEAQTAWKTVESQLFTTVGDKDKWILEIQARLDEATGEIALLKKKHETAMRELRKELESVNRQRKEESLGGISSRTSSSTSLNHVDPAAKSPSSEVLPPGPASSSSSITGVSGTVPDQQALVERIVKLQRALAKKDEKIEFLQEHSKQLLEGIQLKSKIIQAHAMNQDSSALTTEVLPHHKSELAKKGGLPRVSADDTMTLELCLEINRKLQAVLEDSLLKNITLKESMRTLGSEVCRLTELNKELTERLQGGGRYHSANNKD